MLGSLDAFSSFSTDNATAARDFYADTLGLDVEYVDIEATGPMVTVNLPGGARALIYVKDDHVPATHTVLNFVVEDVEATAAHLRDRGVELEHLEWTDDDGIARDPAGAMPSMAWLRDPAGNWIQILGPEAQATDS